MFDSQVLAFTLVALVVTIAPGPDTFLVITNTVASGVRAGLASVAGIVSGGVVYALLAAFGLAQLLVHSERVFLAVKLTGAVYLCYLGIGALRRAWRGVGEAPQTGARAKSKLRACYAQGLLSNVLNPKIAVFYLAFLPQFISIGDPVAAKSVLLIGIHYTMGIAWLSVVAFTVHRLGALLARERVRRGLEGVLGALMLAFGVRLALASR